MLCNLCGNNCNIDRSLSNGKCRINSTLKIARFAPHFFEEPCISGDKGSGTIFFCGCPLSCVFCQNYDVSRNKVGENITIEDLITIMKRLEDMGCHNINLVSPTHYVPQIIEALDKYKPSIPIVYNSHGYDSIETIKALKGYVDIYLPDFKYYDNSIALKYSNVKNYFEVASEAIKEMRAQVNDTFLENGLMKSGLIIRHLILPKNYRDSIDVLTYISKEIPNTLVSVMSQFTPCGDLSNYPEINRKLFNGEIQKVYDKIYELNLDGFIQDKDSSSEDFIPKWDFKGL